MATVITDKLDYAPGETAIITADGFYPGSTIKFQVQHITAGLDGVFGTSDDGLGNNTGSGHDPWTVTDNDGNTDQNNLNGTVQTFWFVNPDDSLNEIFLLTATGAGADGATGTSDDEVATALFTDTTGAYTLNFAAADPSIYLPPVPYPSGSVGTDYVVGGRGNVGVH